MHMLRAENEIYDIAGRYVGQFGEEISIGYYTDDDYSYDGIVESDNGLQLNGEYLSLDKNLYQLDIYDGRTAYFSIYMDEETVAIDLFIDGEHLYFQLVEQFIGS